jgi:hypothetical protein
MLPIKLSSATFRFCFAYLARAQHLEVRTTCLSNMTLKMDVQWHIKEPLLLKTVTVKHKSKFAVLSLVMVTTAR